MDVLARQVRSAQRRLWLNRWMGQFGWMLTFATLAWVLLWIVVRLFAIPLPMGLIALAGLALALVGSIVWLVCTRDDPLAAAAELDRAAGLRERVSTCISIPTEGDPFAAAVVADAARAVAGLTPRRFLPIRWPGSLSLGGLMIAVACLSLLLPEIDILRDDDDKPSAVQASLSSRVSAIAKPLSTIDQIAREQGVETGSEDDKANAPRDLRSDDPDFKRREGLKKLMRAQEALDKKANEERFQALREAKKRLRHVGAESDPRSELSELIDNLGAGDFEKAQDSLNKVQEELARRSREGKVDPEQMKKMQEQLQKLSEQIKEACKSQDAQQQQQQQRQLENAGLSAEDAKRVLENLAKKDPKQLEKLAKELSERLKQNGMTEQKMKEMLQKLQQQQKAQQKASQQCNKMGDKMGQCAKAMKDGDMQKAQQELGDAGEQLSEMEQLEQALNDLENKLSELNQAGEELEDYDPEKDDLKCDQCDGSGFRKDGAPCPKCNGTGQCQGGGRGRGAGARDRDDSAQTATKNEKAKTRQGRGGSIVGQQFVKGQQLKGESSAEFEDAVSAAEIEATDAVNRDRIPRKYRGSVKRFFDRISEDYPVAGEKKPAEGDARAAESGSGDADRPATDNPADDKPADKPASEGDKKPAPDGDGE